jgi:hypothetical protein
VFIHTHLCQCMTESSKTGDMQRHATILRVYWKNPQDPLNNEEFEYNHGNLAIFGCPKSYHLRPHQSWPKWTMLKASAGIQAKCDEIDLIHIIYNILIYIYIIYIYIYLFYILKNVFHFRFFWWISKSTTDFWNDFDTSSHFLHSSSSRKYF